MAGRAALPNWVVKRDSRLVPFDGDKICRSLFAAGERLGRSNPLLARELTDGVLHFLIADSPNDALPSAEIAETTVKIVRELGHPELARAFDQFGATKARRVPNNLVDTASSSLAVNSVDELVANQHCSRLLTSHLAATAMDQFSRRAVYSPDLVAAERDGLLQFLDSDTSLEITGAVVQPISFERPFGLGCMEALETARERIGQYIAIDGPEYSLAAVNSQSAAEAWVRELRIGLRLCGLQAVVNLNCPAPPAGDPPQLFPNDDYKHDDYSDYLLDQLLDGNPENVRVDWHLNIRDFVSTGRSRLLRLARRAIEGAPIAFVPDQSCRPVALAEGLDRQNKAVLCVVGISLPRLAEMVRSTTSQEIDPTVYLTKLGPLARMALSAGQARRNFLRGHARPAVSSSFTIDRARLVVVPCGLAEAVQLVIGQPLTWGGLGLEFARQIVQSLRAALGHDHCDNFLACLDDIPPLSSPSLSSQPTICSGVTVEGTARQQLRLAAALQMESDAGTAFVRLPSNPQPKPEEVAQLLLYSWQQPGLIRVRFEKRSASPRQLSAGWDI